MDAKILQAVEGLSNEKNLSPDTVFEAIQEGLENATKRSSGGKWEIRVDMDRKTGSYRTYRRWLVVEDIIEDMSEEAQILLPDALKKDPEVVVESWVEEEIESIEFSRIASNYAMPIIRRKIQEATRARVVAQYQAHIGELVQGTVKKVARDGITVDLGDNAEAFLPRTKMIPRDDFRMNDRIKALLFGICEEARGPQLVLDRTSPEMLHQLFRLEAPEIAEGIIVIRAAARIAGSRAKISVWTMDGRIDPVGACVGMRGSRVQAVSNQLCNERIDVVQWDENPIQLAVHAMAPAKPLNIVADEDNAILDIAVSEEDLSQAIGRHGENVRLAEELTGWKLNIMTEEDAADKQEKEAEDLIQKMIEALDVDADIAGVLVDNQFELPEEIAGAEEDELLAIEGFTEELVQALQQRSRDYMADQASSKSEQEPAKDLIELDGMNEELAVKLAGNGVTTRKLLADLATFELQDMIADMDETKAGELIMEARKIWDEKPEADSEENKAENS